VARVALLCPDLLFGSKLEGGLRAGGHEVTPFSGELGDADVLVVDLTSDAEERAALVESMRADGRLEGVHTLGFYSHVEQDTRRRADEAGFDLVVPRSRMAREMAALVDRLASA
jgi:hypothetical protein